MSSRDKVPSTAKSASSKTSHKVQANRQHQTSLVGGASSTSKTSAQSSRNTTTNSSVGGAKRGSEPKKLGANNKQQKSTNNNNPKEGKKASSPRGLHKFTELRKGDISGEANEKNSKEMATTTGNWTSNADNTEKLSNRFAEQETDVDDPESRLLLGVDEDDENTGLLVVSGQNLTKANYRGSLKVEEELESLQESPKRDNLTINKLSNNEQDGLPPGWEQHTDKAGPYFWHVSTGVIQRTRPNSELPTRRGSSIVVYHDDEEINQAQKSSSDEDDYYESGAALTVDDTSESTFIVYPLGCCEFDETQLISATSSKAIQKCILRLSNKPSKEEAVCWGLDQSQPIMMKLFDDHIQFTDLKSQLLLRSQPIQTIKTWAVDDNNNFAFVIEDRAQPTAMQNADYLEGDDYMEPVDYALISEPVLMCYVFRSVDEDDMMSCKVAAKLNEEINRYKEQMMNRVTKSTRLQQMVVEETVGGGGGGGGGASDMMSDDGEEEFDELEASNELTMNVKYIGKFPVPRPTGIEVLNVAIDKCLAEATSRSMAAERPLDEPDFILDDKISVGSAGGEGASKNEDKQVKHRNNAECILPTLIEAKLHVSPSSVIVENVTTGEIIVECRIRYLTFMGISKRDIRWCGFIMQNATSKTFVAHCFECYPTAGHVCEAIQLSCTRMYEKVVKNSTRQPETMSIIPTSSKIRNTLAKTLSRIKLNPLR